MPTVVESWDDFVTRHGGKPVRIDGGTSEGGTYLLPDGAVIHNNGITPSFQEPNSNVKTCLEARRRYHQTRLKRIHKDFQRLKTALLGQGDSFLWPAKEYGRGPANGREALLLLQRLAQEQSEALAVLDQEYAALPESRREQQRRAEMEAEENARRARYLDQQAEIAAIKL